MAAETGFMIDGALYEVPSLDTFTMDEAQVLYDYSGLTIEDFVVSEDGEDDGQADRLKNPGFLRSLMHIAYQRGNPKLSPSKVKTLIGAANLLASYEHLEPEGEDDALPPELTTEQGPSSPNGSVGSSESSGDASRTSSDGQVVPLAATTTTGSGTSSTSDQTSSAA